MTIPFVSDRIERFRLARRCARRKRIAVLSLCGFGLLALVFGSVIAGIALYKSKEERCAQRSERRKAVRERVHDALDFSDDGPVAAYYDSEKGEFAKKEDKAGQ